MKNSILNIAAAGVALLAASCGSNATKAGKEAEAAAAGKAATEYLVDAGKSEIKWKGSKLVGVGEHFGTIGLKEGKLHVEDGMVKAGYFLLDMSTIKNLDLEDAEKKGMLEGHFKSDDFFNVEKYPTAKFEISQIEDKKEGENTHIIHGNLTLRDVTKNIAFPAKIDVNDAGLVAQGNVTINRLDWGINYDKEKMSLTEAAQQTAKNGIVSKDITLEIKIQAQP
jgi:polyisoprenoid-binding protein YceI